MSITPIDLFNSDVMELPKVRPEGAFVKFLEQTFKDYLKMLQGLDTSTVFGSSISSHYKTIEGLCEDIKKTLMEYLIGRKDNALATFKQALTNISTHIDAMISVDKIEAEINRKDKGLYRMRTGSRFAYNRQDLFHIPYDKRHRVSTQRYSIPGVPCLYFGGSLYICWEELQRPNLYEIHTSRFELRPGSKAQVIDWGLRPAFIAATLEHDLQHQTSEGGQPILEDASNGLFNFFVANAVCWPLMVACSTKVFHRNASFKEEYIIPQLVLQWIITEKSIHGLRYFSTNAHDYMGDPHFTANYVFPVQQYAEEGHCPVLLDLFSLTKPISWQVAMATFARGGAMTGNAPVVTINLTGDITTHYHLTDFGLIQSELANLKTEFIK